MSGAEVVALILIGTGAATMAVLARSYWLTPSTAQRVSMAAAAIPTLAWVSFYVAVEWGNFATIPTMRNWSRIAVILTYGSFILQAVMVAWSQGKTIRNGGRDV